MKKDIIDKMWNRLMEYGSRLGCHQMPERSFFYHGYQFPVCARCTGVLLGEIAAICMRRALKIEFFVCAMLCVPMALDWGLQYLKIREATQMTRFVTGFLGGVGITVGEINLILILLQYIGEKV